MDYGYRMLRHVVAQVFGNFGQAARLTLVPTFLPLAILLALFLNWGASYPDFTDPTVDPATLPATNPGLIFLTVLATIVISMIAYCWAAVGWHRFVLLEEFGFGVVPRWRGAEVRAYLWRAFLVGLFAVALGFAGLMVLGIVVTIFPSTVAAFIAVSGFTLGLSWAITRVGLILPAAALGQEMSFRESWQATKPVSTDLLVPLFFIALGMTLLDQLVTVTFGNNPLGAIPSALLYWLQILLNLSLLTTLYGTQIQGRALN